MNSDSSANPQRQYRIDLKYVGTNFNGWQTQPDGTGVQDTVESALATVLGSPVRILGASRTDSGVHAQHQVATFKNDLEVDCRKLLASLLALLPPSVGVTKIEGCSSDFHPILSAKSKVYCYRLWRGRTRDPFKEAIVHRIPDDLPMEKVELGLSAFRGEHDFTAFCAVDSGAKTRVREIFSTRVESSGNLTELWIEGSGFLKQMIRIIVGTCLEVAQNKRSLEDIPKLLQGADRESSGYTAPASGLTLEKIRYD